MVKGKDVTIVDEVEIKIKPGVKFNNPLIIEGFQGIGLVGTLSAQYMAQKLGLKRIGYVKSEGIPSLALLVNGKLLNPVKIYVNKSKDLIIIESELSIPRKIIYELSEEIAKWAKKIKAREVICMEGIAVKEEERNYEVYGFSTDAKILKKITSDGVKKLDNGIVIGMSAALLLNCKDIKVPATCLMVESRPNFPDGKAAAALVKKINELYDFKIDVKELQTQAVAFEKKLEKVLAHESTLKNIEERSSNKRSIYG
ncbi:MAG: proteasome assembly chaperone family protein [Promethearchaeota archaeon]|nr:MAG: proteasome assembly chaperone family protein [Candidatus Lokiarchaeota archaeon]